MTGPVQPTGSGVAVRQPLRGAPFRFEGGFLGGRQAVNGACTIPHGLDRLRAGGQWENLRRAATPGAGGHTGRPYTDSDVYKMAEAVAWAGGPVAVLEEVTALVAGAQDEDGYVGSWTRLAGRPKFADLGMGHEMYNAGHLIQAGIAGYRTGYRGLLGPAIRFADHLVAEFGPAGTPGLCGHPEIETALVELYRLTARHDYLALAARMVEDRGRGKLGPGWYGADYYQDDVPVRDATELVGHCVRALYLATGATDVYLETGDPGLLAALTRQWTHTVGTKTYLTGAVGCRRKTEAFGAPFELPPDQAFGETCAAVANLMWSWRMLLATGSGRYADHMERLLFNAIPAGVALSGTRFAYVNTLHRRGSAMERGDKAPYRKDWFDCACCPPNLMRVLASLGHYVATAGPDGIQLHQYAAGACRAGAVGIRVDTDYPWSGEVAVTVTQTPAAAWTLALRIPAWCTDFTVDGDYLAPRDGYAHVTREWASGETVVLKLSEPARLTWPDSRIDAIRSCVAIERGPLVYCLEEADLPAGVRLDELALCADRPARTVPHPDLAGDLPGIEVTVRRHLPRPGLWPYHPSAGPEPSGEPLRVTAIPYHAWDNRGTGGMRVWLPAA